MVKKIKEEQDLIDEKADNLKHEHDIEDHIGKLEERDTDTCPCGKKVTLDDRELIISYDFYVVTYSGFNIEVIKGFDLSPEEIKNNMRSC